jgi:hypothetical protein
MKKLGFALSMCVLSLSSNVFAGETVLDRCVGYTPKYFVELVKIEDTTTNSVRYQVNLMGKVTNFTSATEAQGKFNQECMQVKSWE